MAVVPRECHDVLSPVGSESLVNLVHHLLGQSETSGCSRVVRVEIHHHEVVVEQCRQLVYAESEYLFAIAYRVVVGCSLALVEAEYFGSIDHFLRLLHGKSLLSGIAIHTCEHSLDSIHVHTELAVAEECGTVVLIGEEVACVVSFEQLLGSLQVVYNLSHNLIGRQHRSGFGVECCLVGDGSIGRMLAVDGAVEAQQVEVEEGAQTQRFALYHLVIVGRCEHVAMTLQSGQQIVDVGNDVVLCLVDAVALVEE